MYVYAYIYYIYVLSICIFLKAIAIYDCCYIVEMTSCVSRGLKAQKNLVLANFTQGSNWEAHLERVSHHQSFKKLE